MKIQPAPAQRRKIDRAQKFDHDRIQWISVCDIHPSPENDRLYRPVDPADPEIVALAKSIREHGVREPLVVTSDRFIVSGHRRYAAAKLAGLREVPCRFEQMCRADDPDGFTRLLRECNRQRVKSFDEKLREELVSTDPDRAYRSLIDFREKQSCVAVETLTIRGRKRRSALSKAKGPFLDAVVRILVEFQAYWPLSDRRIHYALLNDPPLIHASKPHSRYRNTIQSYKALVDLLTRARLAGRISMTAIADETRPVCVWDAHDDVQAFLRREVNAFLQGYWRNLQRSQPCHIEIVGEKNTIAPIIKPIAAKCRIPMTIGRGFCSLPPRYEMERRFSKSGKERLVLLIVSDFDAEGEEIAHSLARSLRDDFGIARVSAVKVALTAEQVKQFNLPPMMKAKRGSSNYARFVEAHGDDVFELEALAPETLQTLLQEAIDSVIDVEAFNHELAQERLDAQHLAAVRAMVRESLGGLAKSSGNLELP